MAVLVSFSGMRFFGINQCFKMLSLEKQIIKLLVKAKNAEFSVGTHCGKRCATRNPTIMRKEITKAKTTYCYSLCRLKQSVENGGKVRCRERLRGLGEILREGIGKKVDETAGHGITISIY